MSAVLDKTTLKLEAVLGGAVAANQPDVTLVYTTWNVDGLESKPLTSRTELNSTTDVVILSPPGRQGVVFEPQFISIYNKDTASVTVTVKTDDGTTERILHKATLATLEALQYEKGRGWYALDSAGQLKQAFSVVFSGFTAETSPATGDELILNDVSAGTVDKITLENVLKVLNGLTEDATPDIDADFALTYDTSASGVKKVKLQQFLKTKIITASRAPGAADGSVAYTGVGFKPRAIYAFGCNGSVNFSLNGYCDSALNQYCTGSTADGTAMSAVTGLLRPGIDAANQVFSVTSLDADGFTGTWTKTGAPGGNDWTLFFLCIA